MRDIYEKFDRAFGSASASAISKDGKHIGRVVFKFGSAVTCYAQIWGTEMQFGIARGGNYDRQTAAWEVACAKFKNAMADANIALWQKLASDRVLDGMDWRRRLEDAGYDVQGVI